MKIRQLLPMLFGLIMLQACNERGPTDDGKPPCINCPSDFRVTDFEPAWSPDGRIIAYTHGDTLPGKTGIYVIEPSGQNKRLWYASVGAYAPSWSPDGQWLAFHDGAHIYKRKLNGDSLTQLTFEGRNFFPAWSPDGRWVAYNKSICEGPNTCGIWLMISAGTQHRFLAAYGNYASWHPSGNHILYVTRAVTSSGQVLGDTLWAYETQSNFARFIVFLTGINYDNRHPHHSPDGTKIAFWSSDGNLWIMNSDGSSLRNLTTEREVYGMPFSWSPDGTTLVFTLREANAASYRNGTLWLLDISTGQRRQLTLNVPITN